MTSRRISVGCTWLQAAYWPLEHPAAMPETQRHGHADAENPRLTNLLHDGIRTPAIRHHQCSCKPMRSSASVRPVWPCQCEPSWMFCLGGRPDLWAQTQCTRPLPSFEYNFAGSHRQHQVNESLAQEQHAAEHDEANSEEACRQNPLPLQLWAPARHILGSRVAHCSS